MTDSDDDVLLSDVLNPSPPQKVSLVTGEPLEERERRLRDQLLQKKGAQDGEAAGSALLGKAIKVQRIEELQEAGEDEGMEDSSLWI